MRLTDYEKKLLDGKHGKAIQIAMRVLYDLGKNYEADYFVEIASCHDDSTWSVSGHAFQFLQPPMLVP